MTQFPLISVIIPSHNHDRFIDNAIHSIIDQDYPNLKILLIDDGSTDASVTVAEKALQDCRRPYRLLRQENAGAPATLNRGIQMAEGEYIAILNSDDRYLPGRLSALFQALSASRRRFAFSKVAHIDTTGSPHPYRAHYLHQLEDARQFPTLNFELLRNNIAATTGNFFFHRDLYDEVGGFAPYVTSHDWDYILRVLLVEEPLFVDEVLMEYRIHSGGTLQQNLDYVNHEIEQIMVGYLAKCAVARNPLAPGPAHWGSYWNHFSANFLGRIRALPKVEEQLERMRAEGQTIQVEGGGGQQRSNPADLFRPVNFWADLDLTQISLEIPPVTKEDKLRRRLLLILPWMVMGGAERFALNLMDQLQADGWDISVVCTAPSENGWYGQFCQRTTDVFTLPEHVAIRDYARFFRYLIELRDFDAILLQGSIEGYRFLPTLRGLFPRLPILDYLHFVTPDWMNGGFPRLSYLYRDALDLTITSCEQVRQWMIESGKKADQLRVCPIGVDAQKWKPDPTARHKIRQDLNIPEREVVIVFAARLEAQKQPLIFVETLRCLSEENIAFRALVAGEGSLRSELEQKIRGYGLEKKVTLLGEVDSEKLPALLAAGDIFFLPSQNEGISSAVYEAMACGLPVVGADVGGQSELVSPQCGVLISGETEQEQSEAYAAIIKELIQNEDKRRSMGIFSRERILSGFTLDDMGECIAGLLEEICDLKEKEAVGGNPLLADEALLRETQQVVEFLQARQEWRQVDGRYKDLKQKYEALSNQYFELLQPKPASHWFYLWIRQLFLPVSGYPLIRQLKQQVVGVQKWLKRNLMKG